MLEMSCTYISAQMDIFDQALSSTVTQLQRLRAAAKGLTGVEKCVGEVSVHFHKELYTR
jgi:hypothetical protein